MISGFGSCSAQGTKECPCSLYSRSDVSETWSTPEGAYIIYHLRRLDLYNALGCYCILICGHVTGNTFL